MQTIVAVGFGVALGTFLTAVLLWFHERQTRRALEDVGVRLRRSEARLQAMLRDSHDLIAVIDADGNLTYANPAAERLFGRRVTPLLGASPFAYVHPDDRDRIASIFLESLQRPGETERVEVRAPSTRTGRGARSRSRARTSSTTPRSRASSSRVTT